MLYEVITLLGHQSWHSDLEGLLRVYPEFDETPHVKMPENYVWPNDDGLYCKSYCPLHPDVHKIVFELIDEGTKEPKRKTFIYVNNRLEGNALGTIEGMLATVPSKT